MPALATGALAAAGPALVAGGLALAALAPPGASEGPCRLDAGTRVAGEASELSAGRGVWSLWLRHPPAAGVATTVLWRAQGATGRSFALEGRNREGEALAVHFGPSPVLPQLGGAGLPWGRAGREWGTRVLFPRAGCWRLSVEVAGRRGALAVWVRERPPRPAGGGGG